MTTAPAAIVALSPIATPDRTPDFAPSHTSLPLETGPRAKRQGIERNRVVVVSITNGDVLGDLASPTDSDEDAGDNYRTHAYEVRVDVQGGPGSGCQRHTGRHRAIPEDQCRPRCHIHVASRTDGHPSFHAEARKHGLQQRDTRRRTQPAAGTTRPSQEFRSHARLASSVRRPFPGRRRVNPGQSGLEMLRWSVIEAKGLGCCLDVKITPHRRRSMDAPCRRSSTP